VGLAVKGQLAPARDDHHQHLDLVVAVRRDAIAPVEPDQVGLQVLAIQPPQRSRMALPAARLARSIGGIGSAMPAIFPSQANVSRARQGAGDSRLGSRPRSTRHSGAARAFSNTTGQVPINLVGPLLGVMERPRRRGRRGVRPLHPDADRPLSRPPGRSHAATGSWSRARGVRAGPPVAALDPSPAGAGRRPRHPPGPVGARPAGHELPLRALRHEAWGGVLLR